MGEKALKKLFQLIYFIPGQRNGTTTASIISHNFADSARSQYDSRYEFRNIYTYQFGIQYKFTFNNKQGPILTSGIHSFVAKFI